MSTAPLAAKNEKTLFKYCPQCGITLREDKTAEKRFGVEVMACPVDCLRFTYIVATETLHVVKV